MPHRSIYLVVEPMRPIAEDLAYGLRDHDPEGEVLVASTAEEALLLVSGHPRVTLAIVHTAPAAHRSSALGRALAARRAVSILIGDEAEEEPARLGLPVLQRPYSAETLLAFVAGLLGSPGARPGEC